MLPHEGPNDELQDYEYPDEPDDDDYESDTVTCSECQAEVYEDAEQCPVCGNYIVSTNAGLSAFSLPFLVLGMAGLISVIVLLALGGFGGP